MRHLGVMLKGVSKELWWSLQDWNGDDPPGGSEKKMGRPRQIQNFFRMYRAGGRNVEDRQAKREWRRFLSPCHGFYGEEGNQTGEST